MRATERITACSWAGTGDVSEAVKHAKQLFKDIKALAGLGEAALAQKAGEYRVPVALVKQVRS